MYEEENKYPTIFATPRGSQYSINVSQVFGNAHTFDEVIHVLMTATPEDVIVFHINSDGGQLFSLVALKNAIASSQAQIHMNLMGMAASAGSALFLTDGVSSYSIGENTCMMIHNMISGTGYDNTVTIKTRADYNMKMNERFVRETYKDFLSESEINDVIFNAREIYLEDFEIRERLQKREEMKAQQMKQEFEDSVNAEPDLSQFSVEELEEEIQLCKEDIKAYQREVKARTSLQTRTSTKTAKET